VLRKKQEITEKSAIEAIIRESVVCRLALSDNDQPYIVPLCFGYQDDNLYFHTGSRGRKLEILKRNQKVCFEFEVGVDVVKGEKPCKWNMLYKSVIGSGKAVILENIDDMEERQRAVEIIIRQYSDKLFSLSDIKLNKIVIIKVKIDEMTGKHSSSI